MSWLFMSTICAHRGPKRVLDPMKLELRIVVSHPVGAIVKLSFSARTAALTLSHLSSPIALCHETGSLTDLELTD